MFYFMSSTTPQTCPVPTTTVEEMEELLTVVMILLYIEIVSANADHSFDSVWKNLEPL